MDAVSAYFIIAIPCFTLKSAPVWMINYIASVVMTQPFIFLKKKSSKTLQNWFTFLFLTTPWDYLNVLETEIIIFFFLREFCSGMRKGKFVIDLFPKDRLPNPCLCPTFLHYLLFALAIIAVPLSNERNLAASAVWPTSHSHVCKAGVSWHSAQAWPDSFINPALTAAPNYFSWHKAKLCYSPNAPIYSSQDKRTYR